MHIEQQRPHLGAEEVVGARGAERHQPRRRLALEEVEHDGGVAEVGDHRTIGRAEAADDRREAGGLGAARVVVESGIGRGERPEGFRATMLREESLGRLDELE